MTDETSSGVKKFFIIVICFVIAIIFLFGRSFLGSLMEKPHTGIATQTTTRTADLFQLQVSKEQVESSSFEGRSGGSILGNVGYVQGSSEGKPVHIVDGHAEGVYQKFPQDKDDSEYSEQQKQIRNARLLDTSCEPGSVQMRVWDGQDPGRAPYPIRVIPYYNK